VQALPQHQGGQSAGHGRVATCRWCSTLIVHDPHGNWIHTSRSYACRDRWGTLMPSTAEPVPPRVYRIDERPDIAPSRHEQAE
jgi:hypothetical protein